VKRSPHLKVEIAGLKPGPHNFNFEIGDPFFALFQGSFITHGTLTCNVQLDYAPSLIRCLVEVEGEVELVCDRSLDTFFEKLWFSEPIIFKFGDEPLELSDEIEIIGWKETHLDFSQLVYDFIALTVPIKKLHPKFRAELDEHEGDILLYSTAIDEIEEEKPEVIDPRWEQLLKLSSSKKPDSK